MKFSIPIATDEMRGNGVVYLTKLFESLKKQTYNDFEVIVSDHSKNEDIKKLCGQWKHSLNIIHVASAGNKNNVAADATGNGDIIKPMHQDDYVYKNDCLRRINDAFVQNPEARWGIVGYIHTDERGEKVYDSVIPAEHADIPASTVFYRRGHGRKRGRPILIKDALIVVRKWPFRKTNYIIARQLKMRDRIRLKLIHARRIAQEIKHRIQKITKHA